MVTDYQFALIELGYDETLRWQGGDLTFQAEVRKAATDLSGETGRTVIIYDTHGTQLDAIDA